MAVGVELAVRAMTLTGGYVRDFPTARVTGSRRQLNWWQEGTFQLPLDNPHANDLLLPNEAQIRDETGRVRLCGPVTSRRVDSANKVWEYSVKGPLWYFTKRNLGYAERLEKLTNGGFETGALAPWVIDGQLAGPFDMTAAVVGQSATTTVYEGAHAVQLDTSDHFGTAEFNKNQFLRQRVAINPNTSTVTVRATAWCYISNTTLLPLRTWRHRGLMLNLVGTTRSAGMALAAAQPQGEWHRLSCSLRVPPNTGGQVDIRLYCPFGRVFWDQCSLWFDVRQDFVPGNNPFGNEPWDQANVFSALVHGFQGRTHGNLRNPIFPVDVDEIMPYAQYRWPLGKSDLNIRPEFTPTGLQRYWHFQLEDRLTAFTGGDGEGVFDTLMREGDGYDIDIDYADPDGPKVLRGYAPTKGRAWTNTFRFVREPAVLETSASWGIVGWAFTDTSDAVVTTTLLLNNEDVPDAASYTNVAATGGITLESVGNLDADLAGLQDAATMQGTVAALPAETLELELADPLNADGTRAAQIISSIDVGDTLPVVLHDGAFQREGTYRVMALDYHPESDTATATVVASGPVTGGGGTGGPFTYSQPSIAAFFPGPDPASLFNWKLNVVQDPAPKGHAYAFQFDLHSVENPATPPRGYIQVQTNFMPGDPAAAHLAGRKVVLWSIWCDQVNTVLTAGAGPNEAAFPTYTGQSGSEIGGTIVSIAVDFDYQQGETLEFQLASNGAGTLTLLVRGDQHANQWYLVGQIDGTGNGYGDPAQWLNFSTGFVLFDEIFGMAGSQADCSGFGASETLWSHFHATCAGNDLVPDTWFLTFGGDPLTQCVSQITRTPVGGDSDTIDMLSGSA